MTPDPESAARDEGAERALQAEAQSQEIYAAIKKTADRLRIFTCDDVREVLTNWEIISLDHPNAIGAAFIKAVKAGLIENTGMAWRSCRKGSHKRAVAVWRSCIFQGIL